PVHWPLWPAPLPPFVGGLGLANTMPVVESVSRPPRIAAAIFNFMDLSPRFQTGPAWVRSVMNTYPYPPLPSRRRTSRPERASSTGRGKYGESRIVTPLCD